MSKKKDNGKGAGSRETAEAPSVQEFSTNQDPDGKICVLDGGNLRQV